MVEDPSGPSMVVVVASPNVGPVKADDPDATAAANVDVTAWPLAAANTFQSLQAVVPCAVDLMVSVLDDFDEVEVVEVVVLLTAVKLDQNSRAEVVGANFGDPVANDRTDPEMQVEQVVSLDLAREIIEQCWEEEGYLEHQVDTTALQMAFRVFGEEPSETPCPKSLAESAAQALEAHLSLVIYYRSCAKTS